MCRILLLCIFYFLVSCASQKYHNENIDLHNQTYDYRVFGKASLAEIRGAIQSLRGNLEEDEFIYSVWMQGNVVKVNTVKGLPDYRDGNTGFSYSIKKANGVWRPYKEEGKWVS